MSTPDELVYLLRMDEAMWAQVSKGLGMAKSVDDRGQGAPEAQATEGRFRRCWASLEQSLNQQLKEGAAA